ncbi:MAG TPA: PP2C family protein-serine/threonine phosphatase [Candidatus Acidoferrales bacterium]|nr:PP2C family protein-serine/threonine phosphatase [Candidatus Acidoferrales bacterium]
MLCASDTMNEYCDRSTAFQLARLKSERLRILILLAAIGMVFLVRSFRTVLYFNSANNHLWIITTACMAVVVVYEWLMLSAVNRAMQAARALPRAVWIANTLLETSLPAFVIAFLSGSAIEPAYRPLANPATLVFFVFIILSTLHLNQAASQLSGFVAAGSYLAAALYVGWRPSSSATESVMAPDKIVSVYAITMVVAGFVAGAVAREIKKQAEAALSEAETKHQMERLEHDLDVARSIQQSLLPTSMPVVKGFEIAAWNKPADQTGGDYFDWQQLSDGKILVALADVTGHGIGPALLAAVCRAYARANFSGENGLFAAMGKVNAALAGDLKEGRFVTFVAAVCTPGNPRVEMLSAGHGPLFLYLLKHDCFEKMDAQGLPLGISASFDSDPPLCLDLEHGDMIVLATDGFYEWANAQGEQFGAERMQEKIRAWKDKPPNEIISNLYRAVIDFSGGTAQQDDLTAIVIKRT